MLRKQICINFEGCYAMETWGRPWGPNHGHTSDAYISEQRKMSSVSKICIKPRNYPQKALGAVLRRKTSKINQIDYILKTSLVRKALGGALCNFLCCVI